jgi:hypothetical protein
MHYRALTGLPVPFGPMRGKALGNRRDKHGNRLEFIGRKRAWA